MMTTDFNLKLVICFKNMLLQKIFKINKNIIIVASVIFIFSLGFLAHTV